MRRTLILAAGIIGLALPLLAQNTRIASDFEIRQMEELSAKERDFLPQLAAHLNLGDLHATRNENVLAEREFTAALGIAENERADARLKSDLARYATATLYAALAQARLHNRETAWELAEEGARYTGAEAKTWNMVAIAMSAIDQPRKAVSAARNAVAIATDEARQSPAAGRLLDLAIYQYSLATALQRTGANAEAIRLLETVVASLESKAFERIRKQVAGSEAFEIYSTARGEQAAYLSARNRSQLKLASMAEEAGETAKARRIYEAVLAGRTDDATALAALARIARTDDERARKRIEALDANPFSIDAIRDYRKFLGTRGTNVEASAGSGAGARVRRAIEQMQARENRSARTTLDQLAAAYPGNDVVQYLSALNDLAAGDAVSARTRPIRAAELKGEIESRIAVSVSAAPKWLDGNAAAAAPDLAELVSLLALLAGDRLRPEQKAALDRVVLSGEAVFPASQPDAPAGQTIFTAGRVNGVPFTFAQPTAFRGSFAAGVPLRLDYRILGATELEGSSAFLLEPLKLEARR